MKQQITPKQIGDLFDHEKQIIVDWAFEKRYLSDDHLSGCQWVRRIGDGLTHIHYIPCLTIGQMIEFLDDHDAIPYEEYSGPTTTYTVGWEKGKELCDTLWEAVKQKLRS